MAQVWYFEINKTPFRWSEYLIYQKKFGLPKKILLSPKKNLVYQKEIWSTKKKIWSTKKIFGIPKKNLVDQKNEKLTGQLVYQRDWPKVHGRRYLLVKESESASVLKLLYSRHYKPVLDYKFLIGLDIKEALLNIKHANHIFFKSWILINHKDRTP